MSGQGDSRKGNLNNAGNVLGSLYNTGQYNPEYKEKKGMKFFWIMLVIVFVTAAVILLIKPYPPLNIVRADENGVTHYLVDINVFGAYEIVTDRYFPYPQESMQYLGLEFEYAFIAATANYKEADMIVSTPGILGIISDAITMKNSADYLNVVRADTDRMLKNSKNGFYGMPVSTEFNKISFKEGEYIALMPKITLFSDKQLEKIIKDMTSVYD
ncbi:MAG: hypothetical protein JXN10_01390 [Clostridia bacterium]|nr:hypothetical protein [Clostridia bacterium]MBN2882155.1 hypothetical protein [Clostridia bacterium]